jgi:hypothetical protein
MRHAVRSMFRSVLGVRFKISAVRAIVALQRDYPEMLTLSVRDLCRVSGGGGEDLPKGGW